MFTKLKRPVSRVFIHCSASDAEGPAYTGTALVKTVDSWHRARGFNGIGYHFVIDKAGRIIQGRERELTPAAQEGNNKGTIAICIHGLDIAKFTAEELAALFTLCSEINTAYNGSITFHGHREVNKMKTCPVINYRKVLGLDQYGRMALTKGK